MVPEIDTEFDLPLVIATAGVCLVSSGKISVPIWIDQTEVVSAAQEIALVLESGSDAPSDVQTPYSIVNF